MSIMDIINQEINIINDHIDYIEQTKLNIQEKQEELDELSYNLSNSSDSISDLLSTDIESDFRNSMFELNEKMKNVIDKIKFENTDKIDSYIEHIKLFLVELSKLKSEYIDENNIINVIQETKYKLLDNDDISISVDKNNFSSRNYIVHEFNLLEDELMAYLSENHSFK